MNRNFGEYLISTDKSFLSVNEICDYLAKSYWANARKREMIEKSIDNSTCFGVYHNGKQIGFARVVSDFSTMYWIGDVFINEKYRGNGLGKKLIKCIVESEDFKDLKGILATRDAHGLYEQFGFELEEEQFMRRKL